MQALCPRAGIEPELSGRWPNCVTARQFSRLQVLLSVCAAAPRFGRAGVSSVVVCFMAVVSCVCFGWCWFRFWDRYEEHAIKAFQIAGDLFAPALCAPGFVENGGEAESAPTNAPSPTQTLAETRDPNRGRVVARLHIGGILGPPDLSIWGRFNNPRDYRQTPRYPGRV